MTFSKWLFFLWRLYRFSDGFFARRVMWLWEFGASVETAGRALLLSEGLYHGPLTGEFNEPFEVPFALNYGITGVGLYALSSSEIVPCLYTPGSLDVSELTPHPFQLGGPFFEAILQVFGKDFEWIVRDLIVVETGPMELQYDPGDPIQTTTHTGQLGAPVQWGSSRGFLTAGHVGQKSGTTITDASLRKVGSVVYALDPTGKSATPGIDVAVVEVPYGTPWGNTLGITGTSVATPLAAIDVYRRSTPNPVASSVRSKADWWVVTAPSTPSTTLRAIYLSSTGVTSGGDSGGPVLLQGTTKIIGHVAAGGAAASCIQDVRRQLRKIKSDPTFSSIHI